MLAHRSMLVAILFIRVDIMALGDDKSSDRDTVKGW
ncbi:unnamed protein product, partial [marine sediment metagenome]